MSYPAPATLIDVAPEKVEVAMAASALWDAIKALESAQEQLTSHLPGS